MGTRARSGPPRGAPGPPGPEAAREVVGARQPESYAAWPTASGYIFRVANRTGLAPGKDVRAVEDTLEKVIPADFKPDAHHWLILHGRYVCKARKPDCPNCLIRDLCRYKGKTAAS